MIRFEESLVRQLEIIKSAANAGKLILFVGAGVSQNSGIPGWEKLTEELRIDLTGIEKGKYSSAVIAQMHYNRFGKRAYLDRIQAILDVDRKQPNPIHNLLFDLNPRHILTTNYDSLLEKTAYEYQHPFSVITKDTELPSSKYNQLIIKVHGDFSDGGDGIVLKEDDYLSYPRNYPLVKSFIESLFATSVVLFIGYGYGDNNLKQIIDQVRVYLGDSSHNAFLIKPENKNNPIESDYFSKKNIQVISFIDEMWEYLHNKNPHQQDLTDDPKFLKGLGLNLFKTLNFINRFDSDAYRMSSYNVIDQCLAAIQPIHEEIPFIPTFHLRNLYPFNQNYLRWSTVDKYNYDYHNYALTTENKVIVDLFLAVEVDENGNYLGITEEYLTGINHDYNSLDEKDNRSNNEKLKKSFECLIELLHSNLVFYFPISCNAANSTETSKRINYLNPKQLVDCHSLFFKYELQNSFQKANSSDSKSLTARQLLELGYTFYQFKDYRRACIEFQNAAKLSWKHHQPLIYIISSMNIQLLLKSVKIEGEVTSSDESLKSFIAEAVNHSGVKHIHETAYNLDTNPIQKELISYLLQDELANSVRDVIRQTKHHLNNLCVTFHSNFLSCDYHVRSLFYYLNGNCIVYDNFQEFENIIKEAFEVYCLYYTKTNPRANFDIWYLDLVILYLKPADIQKIIKYSEIDVFEINPTDYKTILQKLSNLLNSSYTQNQKGTVTQIDYNNKNPLFGFNNRLHEMLNSAWELLSKLNLPTELVADLANDFVKASQIIRNSPLDPWRSMLHKHHKAFKNELLEEMLEYLLDHDMRTISLIEEIVNILNGRQTPYIISRQSLLKKIRTLDFNGDQSLPFFLYKLSDNKMKSFLKNKIKERMKKIFHEDDFRTSVILEIIDPKPYLSTYLQKIIMNTNLRERSLIMGAVNYQTKINHWHYRFIIEILIEDQSLIDSKSPEISQLIEKSDHFCWLYHPQSFDYTKFKKDWLLFDRTEWFINRIKTIVPFVDLMRKLIITDQDKELAYFCTVNSIL